MKVLLKTKSLLFFWKVPVVVVIYLLNVIIYIMNIVQDREHLLKQSLFTYDIIFHFNILSFVYSIDPSLLFERNEQTKNKIYERLVIINDEMNIFPLEKAHFELIYECIEKRMIFINFINFKIHSRIERDIDLAILQALLNGKKEIFF